MLVRLVDGPIDEEEAVAHVRRDDCGALLVFHGIVRDHHAGRSVSHIDYHGYRPMAQRELEAVARETAERFEIAALALVHRLGIVRVGEASLFVAASAHHRRPVFEGILRLVDELKRRVPIWKKEHGPDGVFWVEGVLPESRPPDELEGKVVADR
jgi:molybdopterin synthase catalytic subunit